MEFSCRFPTTLCSALAALLASASPSSGALAALWRFDSNTGATQADSTTNGNTASVLNGASWVNDIARSSGTMSYDGLDDRLEAADSPSLSILGNMTVSMWVNLGGLPGPLRWFGLVNKDPAGSNQVAPYQFWFNQGNSLAGFGRGNGTGSDFAFGATSPGNVPVAGSWEHWAVSMSGTAVTIYRNGTPILLTDSTISTAIADGNGPLWIGDRPGPQDMSFLGRMDDVAIFDEALSQTQINTIMGGDFSAFGIVPEPSAMLLLPAAILFTGLRRRR